MSMYLKTSVTFIEEFNMLPESDEKIIVFVSLYLTFPRSGSFIS